MKSLMNIRECIGYSKPVSRFTSSIVYVALSLYCKFPGIMLSAYNLDFISSIDPLEFTLKGFLSAIILDFRSFIDCMVYIMFVCYNPTCYRFRNLFFYSFSLKEASSLSYVTSIEFMLEMFLTAPLELISYNLIDNCAD